MTTKEWIKNDSFTWQGQHEAEIEALREIAEQLAELNKRLEVQRQTALARQAAQAGE